MRRFSIKAAHVAAITFPLVVMNGHAESSSDQRLQALEIQVKNQQRKISALEQQTAKTTPAATSSLNPDISLILTGRFVDFSSGETPSHAMLMNGEEEGLDAGFGLGESELRISSNIDEHFYGQLTAALADEGGETEVELEEAFIQSTVLPGLKARAGRFLSGFGYQNEQHAHTWDISTAPLVYRYFLGGGVRDDGLQFNYILPTTTFVLLGAELLKGAHYPATADDEVGAWTAYINVGGDIGDNASWLVGASHYDGDAIEREILNDGFDEETQANFTGRTQVDSFEAVFKYAPTGNMKQQHIKLQAEFMQAEDKGDLAFIEAETSATSALETDKTGYYVQLSYQWVAQWRASVRYDKVDGELSGDELVLSDSQLLTPWTPEQSSVALDWVPGEFSRVRMQVSHDHTALDSGDLLLLEYTVSLGAHGAHRY